MSTHHVDALLQELSNDGELAREFAADRSAYLLDHRLTEAEREALSTWDVRALYALGANPFLMLTAALMQDMGPMEHLGPLLGPPPGAPA